MGCIDKKTADALSTCCDAGPPTLSLTICGLTLEEIWGLKEKARVLEADLALERNCCRILRAQREEARDRRDKLREQLAGAEARAIEHARARDDLDAEADELRRKLADRDHTIGRWLPARDRLVAELAAAEARADATLEGARAENRAKMDALAESDELLRKLEAAEALAAELAEERDALRAQEKALIRERDEQAEARGQAEVEAVRIALERDRLRTPLDVIRCELDRVKPINWAEALRNLEEQP